MQTAIVLRVKLRPCNGASSRLSHVLAKLERPEPPQERHEARVLDVAGAEVAVDGEVGEAGGGHVARAGLVVREAVLVDVTAAVDLAALEAGPLLGRAAALRAVVSK